MLARQPHFMFTASDVENVIKETGLDKAQVQAWGEQFRYHCKIKTQKEILENLRSTEPVT